MKNQVVQLEKSDMFYNFLIYLVVHFDRQKIIEVNTIRFFEKSSKNSYFF